MPSPFWNCDFTAQEGFKKFVMMIFYVEAGAYQNIFVFVHVLRAKGLFFAVIIKES